MKMAGSIVIVDYGMGNLRSVAKAVESVGGNALISDRPSAIASAQQLILPGVGAFKAGMEGLVQRGLIEPLRARLTDGTPVLGICLGMQILFQQGEEGGLCNGLGVIRGTVKHFPINNGAGRLKIPHMGWNQITTTGNEGQRAGDDCPLLRGIPDGAFMYFVHSYYPEPLDPSIVAARTSYGIEFASMIWQESVYATQFHPEKSQRTGLQLLKNFVELTC